MFRPAKIDYAFGNGWSRHERFSQRIGGDQFKFGFRVDDKHVSAFSTQVDPAIRSDR